MATTKVSDLSAKTTPAGTEELLINDGGTSKKITIANATASKLNLSGGTMTGDLDLNDNVKLKLGTGGDLQLFCDNNNSYIKDAGVGSLLLWTGNGTEIKFISESDGSKTMADMNADGSVDLYYNNSKKFETTATGIDVTGSVTADGVILEDNTTYQGIKFQGASSNRWLALHGQDGDLIFGTGTTYGSGSEYFRIDSSGNVGIGTSSPSQKLHVKSTTSNPTGIGLQNSERYYAVRSNNYSLVFSDETVGTERMRIDSSGNVGIGTSSPAGTIHAVSSDSYLERNTDNIYPSVLHWRKSRGSLASPTIVQDDDTILRIDADGYNGNDWSRCAQILVEVDGTPGDNDMPARMKFATSADGTESPAVRMTIDSSGNVGIGTASPAQELDISSANPAVRLTDTTTSGLYHELVSYGEDLRFSADVGDVEADSDIEFLIDGDEKLKIRSDGRGLSQFTAKAWIRINSGNSITDSHNVSSITDDGVAQYTTTFSNNMANDDYCAVAHAHAGSGVNDTMVVQMPNGSRAVGSIGCHLMWADNDSTTFSCDQDAYTEILIFGD
jgi:hypothetical protein